MPNTLSRQIALAALLLAATWPARAQDLTPHAERPVSSPSTIAPRQGGIVTEARGDRKDTFDKIWDGFSFYKNEESPFLNEFRFVGRLHLDEYSIDSDLGHDQDWIVRRLRLGSRMELFHRHLTAHVEVEIDPQNDTPAYRRLTDAYLSWRFSPEVKLIVGKHSAKFTLDGSTSSNELLTPERNNIANNFWFTNEYAPGVSLTGTIKGFQYNTGFFSGGSDSPEFGNFDAGNFFLVNLGYDFGKALGLKKALIRGDYVYNQRETESTFARQLEDIASAVLIVDADHYGVSADVSRATGFAGQGDLFGVAVMPWYNITSHLQAVLRYTYISGDKDNSVRLNRYENFITTDRGDEYNEIYAGLNYFIYGHKLKLQTGYTYATMHDRANDGGRYAGWTLTTALRASW